MAPSNYFGRRKFLSTTGAVVTGAGVFGLIDGKSSPIDIVTEIGTDGEPAETERVTQDWVDHEDQVDRVIGQFRNDYEQDPSISSVAITPSTKKVDGLRTSQITVFTRPSSDANTTEASEASSQETPNIPDEVDGISVSRKADKEAKLLTHGSCHNNGQFRRIAGGIQMGNGDRRIGTSCAKVVRNGTPYMLIANHVYGSCQNNQGQRAYQAGQYIGTIEDFGPKWDWALIRNRAGDNSFIPGVRYSYNGSVHRITTYYNRAGCRSLMLNNAQIVKQGFASGFTTGYIDAIDDSSTSSECVDLGAGGGYGIRTNARTAVGDSGGPMFYRKSNGTIGMIGHLSLARGHQYFDPTGCNSDFYNTSIAMSFYKLRDVFGFNFVS